METHKFDQGTVTGYIVGFILSLFLTMVLYATAIFHSFSGWVFPFSLYFLGTLQAALQLKMFVGMAREPRPRWNMITLLFMVLIVVIVVALTLWIMANLNYNLMAS